MMNRPHIDANGQFQSTKFPDTPPDCLLLKLTDLRARQPITDYANTRHADDPEFADDLLFRLAEVSPGCGDIDTSSATWQDP